MGALYELVLTTSFMNQQCINRWNYDMQGTPAAGTGSFLMAKAFGAIATGTPTPTYPATGVIKRISNLVHTGVKFAQLTVKNIYDPVDFYQAPFIPQLLGAFNTGEAMAPFVSFGFRTNLIRLDVARGTKRFPGVPEAAPGSGGGVDNAPGSLTQLLASAMSATLLYTDEGNSLSFIPVVCGKQKYNPDTGDADENGRAYRYFPTESAQRAKMASGVVWEPYEHVRSQTSRQYGRGQ